ncbi:MAG: BlaI/MecI/CopY family transcriptional regulator [Candidatus Marinimicrobia bacterium]|nr:BlaI/MecI/CopY family transcriptional regulator [Candidatus Neomarinimicrobiota bacterium]
MSSKLNLDALSQFEWLIMNHLWVMDKASAREVMEAMPDEAQRAYTTIQTYLERLVDKGYVSKEKIGMVNFYTTQVPRADAVHGATESFIERVFQGSGTNLAAYLLQNKKLNPADLAKIRAILNGGDGND